MIKPQKAHFLKSELDKTNILLGSWVLVYYLVLPDIQVSWVILHIQSWVCSGLGFFLYTGRTRAWLGQAFGVSLMQISG